MSLEDNDFSSVVYKLLDLCMVTLIMHSGNKQQLMALKGIKIIVETRKSAYNLDFVALVKGAKKKGNYKTIDRNDVWGSLNLKVQQWNR